jgi:hypothetical protein
MTALVDKLHSFVSQYTPEALLTEEPFKLKNFFNNLGKNVELLESIELNLQKLSV